MKTSAWTGPGKWRYRYIFSKNRKTGHDWIEFKHQEESYFAWGTTVGDKWYWYPVDEDCNIIGPPVDDGVSGDEWWMWFVNHGQRPLPEGLI